MTDGAREWAWFDRWTKTYFRTDGYPRIWDRMKTESYYPTIVWWNDDDVPVCYMCGEPSTNRINIPGHGFREYCTEHADAIMQRAAANGMGLGVVE